MTRHPSLCYYCGECVHPTQEGFCPSCTRFFKPAEEDQTEFEVSPPTKTAPSPQVQLMTKAAIIFLVFPTFAWLISALFGLVLALPSHLLPESSQAAVLRPIQIASQMAGLIGAILISKRIWPKKEPSVQW